MSCVHLFLPFCLHKRNYCLAHVFRFFHFVFQRLDFRSLRLDGVLQLVHLLDVRVLPLLQFFHFFLLLLGGRVRGCQILFEMQHCFVRFLFVNDQSADGSREKLSA